MQKCWGHWRVPAIGYSIAPPLSLSPIGVDYESNLPAPAGVVGQGLRGEFGGR